MEFSKTVYVLELADECYYVGSTHHLAHRLEQHRLGTGSAWTRLHPMIHLVKQFAGSLFDEERTVLEYMRVHGIDRVRGASYSNVVLSQEQFLAARRAIYHAMEQCLACGSKDHWITRCRATICYRCGAVGHPATGCNATTHCAGGRLDGCVRCGRESHWAIRCRQNTDVYGRTLSDDSNCAVM